MAFFLWIQSNLRGFCIAGEKLFRIANRFESHRTLRWHRTIRATKFRAFFDFFGV